MNKKDCQHQKISVFQRQLSFQEDAEAVDPLLQANSIHIVSIEEPKEQYQRMRIKLLKGYFDIIKSEGACL